MKTIDTVFSFLEVFFDVLERVIDVFAWVVYYVGIAAIFGVLAIFCYMLFTY